MASSNVFHSAPYKGDPMAAAALGVANFVNGVVIRHPFAVLRRQCQVHDFAYRKHIAPVTLLPVIVNVAQKDGLLSLWKGAVGSGMLWAFSRLSELIIAELFNLPKSYVPDGSSERFWRHVYLKSASYFACTPVIVASFIETVRSGASLVEDLQLFEVIYRGFERFRLDLFGGAVMEGRRRHPLFWLAFPTSLYHIAHFLLARYVYSFTFACTRAYVSRKLPSERKRYHTIMPELFSTMTSAFVADLAFYPLETVLHRLYIQGTRTLVDNLDHGTGAFVPTGRYTGLIDCFATIVRREGAVALYSGVGALFLQYFLQHCVAGAIYWLLDRGNQGYTSGPSRIQSGGFGSLSQAPSAQFAATASTSQAPALGDYNQSCFPTFAQTQQNIHLAQDNNPFLAAIRNRSSNNFAADFSENADS